VNRNLPQTLPAHFVRPADSLRNPKGSIPFAFSLLQRRELTRDELGDALEAKFSGQGVDAWRMVSHLRRLGHVAVVDGQIGLTAAGAIRAEAVLRELPQAKTQRPARRLGTRQAARLLEDCTPPPYHPSALTASPPRMRSSEADGRTAPLRPGAEACLALPSRIGERLHYRDGLVTDMAGQVLQPATRGEHTYRSTRNGASRARPAYSRD